MSRCRRWCSQAVARARARAIFRGLGQHGYPLPRKLGVGVSRLVDCQRYALADQLPNLTRVLVDLGDVPAADQHRLGGGPGGGAQLPGAGIAHFLLLRFDRVELHLIGLNALGKKLAG